MGEPIDLDKAKKARRGAARRSAQPSADDTVVRRVEKMNVDYAFTLMGGKPVVLHEKTDFRGVPQVDFLGLDGFLRWWDKERVWDDETDKMIGVGHIWMRHPDRRDYLGVEFAPEGVPEGWFNLWRGFAVSPAAPYADVRQHATHFPRFSKHILENVAQGNRDVARWVWAFFAQMIQQPEKKPGTALALRGKQGCGKTKVGEVFGSLLARHWVKVAKPSHLTGNFNAHMFACLLLQADEGFWAGDKGAEGALKDLVTGDIHQLERKGIDAVPVRNLIRLLITSNSEWVVPAGFEERRFAVLDVGNGNLQDHAFFAAIDQEMDEGGRQHLLAYLLGFDLSKVNLRTIPQTGALWEQKVASMSELHHWWWDRLKDGRLLPEHSRWMDEVAVDRLYNHFWRFFDRISRSRKPPKEQWAIELRKMLPPKPNGGPPFRDLQKVKVPRFADGVPVLLADGSIQMERVNGWKGFPGLDECRAYWEDMVGNKFDWAPADDDDAGPDGQGEWDGCSDF